MRGAVRRWRTLAAATAMIGLVVAFGGCLPKEDPHTNTDSNTQPTGPISVVASVNQWGSLAAQIGGDDVDVISIVNSTAVDAHDFEPQTADMAALQQAQIVISNGAGYDAWATKNLGKDTVSISAAETVGASEGDNPHLWFSKDARNGMATELAEAFSKALPDRKEAFQKRLDQWQEREQDLEDAMEEFSQTHPDATYAATESVAHYLMSDLGFENLTPKGYLQSSANESEPAPADLQDFQELMEDGGVDVLVNNVQQGGDASALILEAAQHSEIPVFEVSEQMPEDFDDPTDWIASLVASVDAMLPQVEAADDDLSEPLNEETTPQDE